MMERQRGTYGRLGRIGMIEPSSSVTLAAEVQAVLPPGVLVVFSRLRLPGKEVTVEGLDAMLAGDALELATAQLVDANVDIVSFACTSGSLIHGAGWDERLVERMKEAGAPAATTTSAAVLARLRDLEVRTLAVGTPYVEEINEAERQFLTAAGFEVVHMEGLGLASDEQIDRLTFDDVRDLCRRVAQTPSDAVFLSCTNLPGLPLLEELERECARPLVTSNSATIWDLLRRLPACAEE